MSSQQRLQRDRRALKRLIRGEPWERVAYRVGLSRVQLWRRVGEDLARWRASA